MNNMNEEFFRTDLKSDLQLNGGANSKVGEEIQGSVDGISFQGPSGENKDENSRVGETDNNQSTGEEGAKAKVEITEEVRQSIKDYIRESIKAGVSAVNYFEIKAKYPKALQALEGYMSTMAPTDEDTVIGALLYGATIVLYRFLDYMEVFLNVTGSKGSWVFSVEGQQSDTIICGNRAEAESLGFLEAFKILEGRL
jgi:hypothetical protein